MAAERLVAGTIWHPPTQADQNTLADIIDEYRRRKELSTPAKHNKAVITTDVLKVKNLTGSPLLLGNVVEVGDSRLLETNRLNLVFDGNEPTTDCGQYGIMRSPLIVNGIATAQIAGIVEAIVNVTDVDHKFATPVPGSVVLQSRETAGRFRIWQDRAGTGEQNLMVMLDIPCGIPESGAFLIARENLRPFEKNKLAALAFYNPATDTWEDDGSDPVGTQELHDDSGRACVLPGEMLWCDPRPFDATHNPDGTQWDITSPFGLRRRVKVLADIACGGTGLVAVWSDEIQRASCKGFETDPVMELSLCNTGMGYHRDLFGEDPLNEKAARQDFLEIGWDGYHWYIIRDVRPTQGFVTPAADFCQDPNILVPILEYADWADDECDLVNPNITTVANPLALAGNSGDSVRVAWREGNAGDQNTAWEAINVQHKGQDVVEKIEDQESQGACPDVVAIRDFVVVMKSVKCPVPQSNPVIKFVQVPYTANIYWDAGQCSFFAQEGFMCAPSAALGEIRQLNPGGEVTVLTAIVKDEETDMQGQVTNCQLTISSTVFCALSQPAPAAVQPDPIVFTSKPAVEGLRDEPDCLYADVANHFVMCADDAVEAEVLCYTECEPEQANPNLV